jgi:uncharacterized protein YjiS (DUF1127 family)
LAIPWALGSRDLHALTQLRHLGPDREVFSARPWRTTAAHQAFAKEDIMLSLVHWSIRRVVASSQRRKAHEFALNASDALLRDIGLSRGELYRAMTGSRH